jgi:hypothetical protein
MKHIMTGLVAVLMFVASARAQKVGVVLDEDAGWHKIGTLTADFSTEKDAMLVIGADRFKKLKLKVIDAPVSIYDLRVEYENGEIQTLEVRQDLKAGEVSKVLDLKMEDGQAWEIKNVVMVFQTAAKSERRDKAKVELYGLK